jgi:hypothetical protein
VALAVAWSAPASAEVADSADASWHGGFDEAVPVISEIGLWADALTELGYGERAGLLVWWGLDTATATAGSAAAGVDWSKVTFRVRMELLDQEGERVAASQLLVDPLGDDEGLARGGFPVATHLFVKYPGRYLARLEAYPLISPAEAGLDSVPRGLVEVEALVAAGSATGAEWQISDLLFVSSLEDWVTGSPADRTWYEWVLYPNVPRNFAPDSSGAFLAFEIERGEELVPSCSRRHCRVVISILDDGGGIVQQALREVPEPASVTAYVVPFETIGVEAGRYHAQVEVFEGGTRLLSVSRSFAMRQGADTDRGDENQADPDDESPGDAALPVRADSEPAQPDVDRD